MPELPTRPAVAAQVKQVDRIASIQQPMSRGQIEVRMLTDIMH